MTKPSEIKKDIETINTMGFIMILIIIVASVLGAVAMLRMPLQ